MKQYTFEKNILQVIALLKKHGISKVIASPGGTNVTFIGSIQNDPFFEIYSCVDERSAAYLACGLSEESGEPVVISCTGATAARNYPSALTEAYYRKLPILAITSSQHFGRLNQLMPQFTDRNNLQNDIVQLSVQIPNPETDEDYWANNVKINTALLKLKKDGGGPVHINLSTQYSISYSNPNLPDERMIRLFSCGEDLPEIDTDKVLIFVGSHSLFDERLTKEIDEFCEKYNGLVLCDHTSNYKGKFRQLGGLIGGQNAYHPHPLMPGLIIHIGEISGSYYSFVCDNIWRVSSDGEVRDTFKHLSCVFDMSELSFFQHYNKLRDKGNNTYLKTWRREEELLNSKLPELPFSNPWVAQQISKMLPANSTIYLGILNTLRSWNLFEIPNSVSSYSTVGGFGIDGLLSSCVGASLYDDKKIYFCFLGDLSTFYDLNVLGNRHIKNNLRILVINNGTGFEMHNPNCGGSAFGEDCDKFFAAGGHFGNKSIDLLKQFTENLGFNYISASDKDEFMEKSHVFLSPDVADKPIFFEVFVNKEDDYEAYNITRNIAKDIAWDVKGIAKNILGDSGYEAIKRALKK